MNELSRGSLASNAHIFLTKGSQSAQLQACVFARVDAYGVSDCRESLDVLRLYLHVNKHNEKYISDTICVLRTNMASESDT
jgi:hypothetical protein